MSFESKDLSGALFKAKPNDNPNWPTHEGSALIAGTDYWISAWVKEGKAGKFFSLAFKPKDTRGAPKYKPKAAPDDDFDL